MPTYKVTDPATGKTLRLTGDSPPTEQELNEVFGVVGAAPTVPTPTSAPASAPPTEAPGLLSRVGSKLGEAYKEATNPALSTSRQAIRSFGTLGEAAGDVMLTSMKGAANLLTSPTTRETISDVGAYLGGTDIGKAQKATLGDISRAWGLIPEETRTDIGKAANIPNLVPAIGAARLGAPIVKEAALIGADVARLGGQGIASGARKTANLIKPKPTTEQALGQVLQSKAKTPDLIAKDLAKGKEALALIGVDDILKAKKGKLGFSDLSAKIEEAIPPIARQVDAELMRDPVAYSLDDLSTVQKTKGGRPVTSNYIKTSIDHLKELYEKTGDPVKAVEMDDLLAKATMEGFTKKEVNDLARIYGSEFKAFNPTIGVPLTSVNAQAYENVRSGLKEVARRGLSDTAKALDSKMSSLYNTKRLIDQNATAANKLRQKIDERGLGEKIGRRVWDAIDIATAGIAKGALLKMIPRGMGYKTKNFIDLEESLTRNLKIINDELKGLNSKAFIPVSKTGQLMNARLGK